MNEQLLIVDDHAEIRHLIRATLGRGFDVSEAEDGETGLAMIRANKPRVVLLDVMMPGAIDGFAVLKAIRDDPALAAVRVIMVTARGTPADHEKAVAMGAADYFVKPFSPQRLVHVIRDSLGLQQREMTTTAGR